LNKTVSNTRTAASPNRPSPGPRRERRRTSIDRCDVAAPSSNLRVLHDPPLVVVRESGNPWAGQARFAPRYRDRAASLVVRGSRPGAPPTPLPHTGPLRRSPLPGELPTPASGPNPGEARASTRRLRLRLRRGFACSSRRLPGVSVRPDGHNRPRFGRGLPACLSSSSRLAIRACVPLSHAPADDQLCRRDTVRGPREGEGQ
jgi:hypothetical protein